MNTSSRGHSVIMDRYKKGSLKIADNSLIRKSQIMKLHEEVKQKKGLKFYDLEKEKIPQQTISEIS